MSFHGRLSMLMSKSMKPFSRHGIPPQMIQRTNRILAHAETPAKGQIHDQLPCRTSISINIRAEEEELIGEWALLFTIFLLEISLFSHFFPPTKYSPAHVHYGHSTIVDDLRSGSD